MQVAPSPSQHPAHLDYGPRGITVVLRGERSTYFGLRFEASAIELAAQLNRAPDPAAALEAWHHGLVEHTERLFDEVMAA